MQDKKDHRGSLCDQNNDVSELHGFEVQGDSIDIENEENHLKAKHEVKVDGSSTNNRGHNKKPQQKNKHQNTLTRQSGFHNDSDPKEPLEAPSFDLRTEEGDILVVVSNLDVEDGEQEQIINIEEGDLDIDGEDNFEYSSARLQQGRGSASSVHSEPDNADNCSVSVGLSVSSLGSDNEDELQDDDLEEPAEEDKNQGQRKGKSIDSQRQVMRANVCIFLILLFIYCGEIS